MDSDPGVLRATLRVLCGKGFMSMREPPLILVVDDVPDNVEILEMRLESLGYQVATAGDGIAALEKIRALLPDLVLLDIMMPKLDGIETVKRLKADPSLPFIPVILVTAKADASDVVSGLDSGADDYLTKPVDHAALTARVRAMLRIKALHDTVREQAQRLEAQAAELAAWNRRLEERVAAQVSEIERIGRLKRFLAPQLAETIIAAGGEAILERHRRDIVVLFCDMRGFTAFAETAEPEDVMAVLGEYHAALGPLIHRYEGTLDRFTGDGMLVVFNDPVPCPDPALRAVRLAVEMREAVAALTRELGCARSRDRLWRRHRPGLCDIGPDRLRGPLRLHGDRHRDQSRGPALRYGRGRADSRDPADRRRRRKCRPVRNLGRDRVEGAGPPGRG